MSLYHRLLLCGDTGLLFSLASVAPLSPDRAQTGPVPLLGSHRPVVQIVTFFKDS